MASSSVKSENFSFFIEGFMAKNEVTSPTVAKKASKLLRDPKSSKKVRSVSASALTQARDKKVQKKK